MGQVAEGGWAALLIYAADAAGVVALHGIERVRHQLLQLLGQGALQD
jgi:hypothetical protein